jgi:hypothetical protein
LANFNRTGISDLEGELGTGFASLRFPAFMGREAGNNFMSTSAVDCGPWLHNTGGGDKRYCLLYDTRSLMVLESGDGLVWDELDTENAPDVAQDYQVVFDASAGMFHVAARDDTSAALELVTFDLGGSPQGWGSLITGGPTLGTGFGFGGALYLFKLGRRSDGSYVIAYRIDVSSKSKVRLVIYDEAASPDWGTPIDIDPHGDADSRHAWPVGLWVDSVDRTHVLFCDNTGDGVVHHRSIDFDETVNGVTTLTYGPSSDGRDRFGPSRSFDGRMLCGMQEDNLGDAATGYPTVNFATLSGVSPSWEQERGSEADLMENDLEAGYPDVVERSTGQFDLIWADDQVEGGNWVTNMRRTEGGVASPSFPDAATTIIRTYGRVNHLSARLFNGNIGFFYSPADDSQHVRYYEFSVEQIGALYHAADYPLPVIS